MKIIAIGVGLMLVALSACASGQSGQAHLRRATYAPNTQIAADDITYDEASRTTYARGNVRIVSESSTITADEADLRHLRDTRSAVDLAVDLRGTVRVVITPNNSR